MVRFFLLLVASLTTISSSYAAVVFGLDGNGSLSGGSRWNAAPRTFSTSQGSIERSLDGGLRFSVSGGNYEAFRDQFNWSVTPSVLALRMRLFLGRQRTRLLAWERHFLSLKISVPQ
ncbi:hypothetical protein Poly51_04380 [Rubripirellula tenax]|uniref:Uncharacterized protein n=1 Tax=Rubripirellula tenax TaxID=2528015 RepID=A0A5C6FHX7_9BACT|nr:hypothetical protein Poly51_04380 [Rubripirellula tenax]